MRWPRATPVDGLRARREVERQLEWAEVYIAAAERIELGDPHLALEIRRLRAAVRETLRNLDRPRVL
ncbi:MAG TPA: hypothetical protein VF137_00060 [Candidatus Dormibacteraeota bacterium]